MRNDIMLFCQCDSENLYEAWERFKDLLQRCPHHGLPKWLLVQTFYYGLCSTIQITIDAAAGGSLMVKPVDEAYNLLEKMTSNNYQWQLERHMPRSNAEINKVEVINALSTQIATLNEEIHSLRVQSSVNATNLFISCELCGGGHLYDQCPENSEFEHYTSNPYGSNAICFIQKSKAPLPPVEGKPSMEEMFLTYMAKTDSIIQSQAASLRNLETQMEQFANAFNNRSQRTLPGDVELNSTSECKEHCKAIVLRSEKEKEANSLIAELEIKTVEEASTTEEATETEKSCEGKNTRTQENNKEA